MTLRISSDLWQSMIEHCRNGLPNEACGFLAGRENSATKIYRLTNAAASPVYYRPADREMLAAMDDIDRNGLDLCAIFHSHVASAPNPSPTDIREAHYPDALYVIVSLADHENPAVRGWRIIKRNWRDTDGSVEEVGLTVDD